MPVEERLFFLKSKRIWDEIPIRLKIIIGITLFSLFLNFWFATSLLLTAPKVQIDAQVLLEDAISSEQQMEAEPFSTDVSSRYQLEEALVLFYLQARYRLFPDAREMRKQLLPGGVVYLLSSPSIYAKVSIPVEFDKMIQKLPYTQVIDVKTIVRNQNTWTIDFDLVRSNPDDSYIRIPKNVVLTVAFSPKKKFFSKYWSNTYGQYVVSYQESDRVR